MAPFPIDPTRPLGAIVVGRAGMDLYPIPDGTAIPEATEFTAEIGGSAGNIAVALTRLGVAAAFVGPLSADAVGRFVRQRLAGYGVDVSRSREVAGDRRTSLALAETRAPMPPWSSTGTAHPTSRSTPQDADPALVASAAVLIVTGTALAAEPSRSGAMAFIAAARAAGTFAILDIDHRPYSWPSADAARDAYRAAAALCNAVIANHEEFAVLAGGEDGGRAAADAFVRDGGDFVIYKRGARGSTTIRRWGDLRYPAFPVDLKKPFGAGDAFMGGVVAGLVGGIPLEEAVRRGAAGAAHVVARRGCASAMPTQAEVDAVIARTANP